MASVDVNIEILLSSLCALFLKVKVWANTLESNGEQIEGMGNLLFLA